MPEVLLPYGGAPLRLTLRPGDLVVEPRRFDAPAPSVRMLLDDALEQPVGAPPVERLVGPGDRVTIVVSDDTRDEPRGALVEALLRRLPPVRLTVAVATGTHGPCAVERLGLPAAGHALVMHDHRRRDALVTVGFTRRGTPVRLHRCAADADLVIATGAIRPHYFAGFGAGIKAIFPGLGGEPEIRRNHLLKDLPGARAGVVDGNPCREDLEEVAGMLRRTYLLNTVQDADDRPRAAVAGDVRVAFRAGAALARPWFLAAAPRRRCIVVSDRLPVVGSLYQASKLVAAVAPLLEPGGTIVVAAECPNGIGGVVVVNEAIYELGLRPRLPEAHRVVLVSGLAASTVAPTYARWAASVEDALRDDDAPRLIVPRATKLLLG